MSGSHIDNQDLSKVTYTGDWVRGGTITEYDQTVASSTNVGDYFTVTFKGTSIAVYGTFDATSQGVITNYSIDGAPAVQVTAQYGFGDIQHQQFWIPNQLPFSEHKFVVTMAKINFNPEPGEGTVWFDYFIVTSPTIVTSSGGTRPSSTPPRITSPQKHIPVGAIVGGVTGGLFFLFAVGFFFFYRRRRNFTVDRFQGKPNDTQPTLTGLGSVTPFILDTREVSSRTPLTTPNSGSDPSLPNVPAVLHFHKSSATERPTPPVISPPGPYTELLNTENPAGNSRAPNTTEQNLLSINTPILPQSSSENQHPTRQHVDGGARASTFQAFNSLSVPLPVDLPPVYSPV